MLKGNPGGFQLAPYQAAALSGGPVLPTCDLDWNPVELGIITNFTDKGN